MKIQPMFHRCGVCGHSVKPSHGVIVEGNVYVVVSDPGARYKVFGNCIPAVDSEGKVNAQHIREIVVCLDCFVSQVKTVSLGG